MTDQETTSVYQVKAGSFLGPLELLLSLIEERKLFVNEIALAEVTNDYIAHIKSLNNIDNNKRIADVSYFILVAATLILIKSKSLLPSLALTEEEEGNITDLEKRLKLYQIIKNASINVKNNFGSKIIFEPCERVWNEPLFSPDPQMTIPIMVQSMSQVLNNLPKKEEILPEVEVKKVINIEEMINNLTDRIQGALNISFREFSGSQGGSTKEEVKVNVIVSFLAMLELVREGIIDVIQNATFEDIEIKKQEKEPIRI